MREHGAQRLLRGRSLEPRVKTSRGQPAKASQSTLVVSTSIYWLRFKQACLEGAARVALHTSPAEA